MTIMRAAFKGDEYDTPEDKLRKRKKKIIRYTIGITVLSSALALEYNTSRYLENGFLSLKSGTKQIISYINNNVNKSDNLESKINLDYRLGESIKDQNNKSKTNKEPTYEDLVSFYKQNKDLFKIVYQGKFDINNDGILDDVTVYAGGDAVIRFNNGLIRKMDSEKMYEFFLSSILNKDEMPKGNDGLPLYRDLISDENVIELEKKNPGYLANLKNLGYAIGLYTVDVNGVNKLFDSKFKKLAK